MVADVAEFEAAALTDCLAFRQHMAAGLPFVVRGLCTHWPAVHAASESNAAFAAYLARFATDRRGELFIGEPAIGGRYFYGETLDSFNFERWDAPLAEGLARILASATAPGGKTIYMGSLRADHYAPGFAQENSLSAVPAEVSPRLWLGNASCVNCHYDTYDNVACVVAGGRNFTLFPPDAIGDLYVGPIERTLAGAPVSLAAGAPAGDPRYPRYALALERAVAVELLPGDGLYLPKLWWHQVEATAPFNVLVNYWWDAFSYGPDAPMTTLLLAMLALAERPEAERAAWRALFDHFVFRPNGHPLAHLPPEEHGMLGSLSKGNYGRLRAQIMQLLRGG